MKFTVACKLHYSVEPPNTLLLSIRPRVSPGQNVSRERFEILPPNESELIHSEPDHNRFDRIRVLAGDQLAISYEADVDVQHERLDPEELRKVSPAHIDPAHLPFLLPSRYCESDRLGRFAWQKFGSIEGVYDQVLGITTWIHATVEYLPGATNSSTSAFNTVTDCAGVCRDFAHLGIALCRALTIPARYVSCYACHLDPPDFHACFEAFIGGRWVIFDATRLAAPNGLVRIGSGRDAADVSVCTVFGPARSTLSEVSCLSADGNFQPLSVSERESTAVTFE